MTGKKSNKKKIGVLTGGGDCPGLNAVIRAIVRRSVDFHWEVVGIKNGWRGLLESDLVPLDLAAVSGILNKGGTILGTSRTNPAKSVDGIATVQANLKKHGFDAIIAIGGEDTLGVAAKLHAHGAPVVGVPKTIDNDLSSTDFTFGFDTAVNVAMEAIDRLHSTAEAHHRIMVVEVMGRHTGWIATYAGIAGGADCILIPEEQIAIETVCELVKRRKARGKDFSIVVVAEGAKLTTGQGEELVLSSSAKDEFGHVRLGGIGTVLADQLEKRTGLETRVTVLGHIQRGGSPTSFDRVLATRFGVKAAEMVRDEKWGMMAALHGTKIESVALSEAVSKVKKLDPELYALAQVFFG